MISTFTQLKEWSRFLEGWWAESACYTDPSIWEIGFLLCRGSLIAMTAGSIPLQMLWRFITDSSQIHFSRTLIWWWWSIWQDNAALHLKEEKITLNVYCVCKMPEEGKERFAAIVARNGFMKINKPHFFFWPARQASLPCLLQQGCLEQSYWTEGPQLVDSVTIWVDRKPTCIYGSLGSKDIGEY